MEMSLIKVDGKEFTRLKISNKELPLFTFIGISPIKKSSRFTYFEVEGNLMNQPRKTFSN